MMTARWYAAWILFLNVCIVFVMYGVWLTLTLTGRLALLSDAADLLAHKHSMTGLNLSSGNGLLVYEEGSNVSGGSVGTSSGRYHSSVTQRSSSVSSGGVNSVVNNMNSSGSGFLVGGVELTEIESKT